MGLAALNPLLASMPLGPGDRRNCTMKVDLSFRQIESIEDKRKGSDVEFMLNLGILTARKRQDGLFDDFSSEQSRVSMPRWGEQLKIPQSEWVKMLAETGYERLRVVELPVPEPPIGTAIDSSLRHIEEALKSFNEGDYDDVLGNCRNAVEGIEHANLDLLLLLRSESKAKKIDGIKRKVKDYLNLGAHLVEERIDRKDAEIALQLTVSLVRYLAKALEKQGTN